MKKLFIVIMILVHSSIYSQWFVQNSGTTDYLYGIQFIDLNSGWFAGSNQIFKSTDGGTNWSLQTEHSPIVSFYYLNENIAWFISRPFGKIFKTTDGGTNWAQICDLSCVEFWNLKFINENVGFALAAVCLDGGKIFKTTNSGVTWEVLEISSSLKFFSSFKIIDEQNIIVASDSAIHKTTNGGTTWIEISVNIPDRIHYSQFINQNTGWAKNYSNLYKTTNGGTSWTLQAEQVNSFSFFNSNTGWYSSSNNIYKTINGGVTWMLQNSNTNNNIRSFFFLDEEYGWAVGENGTVIFTPNGGLPVELISFNADVNKNSVSLNWITATETNNSGFEVQKYKGQSGKNRVQNEDWEVIGFVNGNGTSTELNTYSFNDENVSAGKYIYRLKQIDYDGSFEYSKEIEVEIGVPDEFALYQNYPNPFNPATKIRYSIPSVETHSGASQQNVLLKVYDVLSNEIATLVNEEKPPGEYEVEFNAKELASGIYFYRLKAGSNVISKKMVILK